MTYKDFNGEEIIKGIKYWKNPKNNFNILAIHYSSDPEKDPERQGGEWYRKQRLKTPKANWEREYEIDFAERGSRRVFGSDYCDLDPGVHFIPSFTITNAELAISLDFGQSNPNHGLIGAYKNGTLYIIDEYVKPAIPSKACLDMRREFRDYIGNTDGKTMDEVREMFNNSFQVKVIDPTTRNKNRVKSTEVGEIPYSVLEEFYDNGFEFSLGHNDVEAGITRIRELFRLREDGKPRIYIFIDKCPVLCRQIEKYRYKTQTDRTERENNLPEQVVKKDDHGVDALRYLVMEYLYEPEVSEETLNKIQKDIRNLQKPIVINDMDF